MANSPDSATKSSFDDIFCGLLARLYRRAAMLTGTRHAAEDAVHETYLKLAVRPQRLPSHPEPYAYAFTALMSVVRDTWRRERRQVLVEDLEAPGLGPAAESGGSTGGYGSWDGGVEQRVSELEAVRMLRNLSLRQAGVVILVDLDGYTIDQAADIMNIHRGTAARYRARALDKLRRQLGETQLSGSGRQRPHET